MVKDSIQVFGCCECCVLGAVSRCLVVDDVNVVRDFA